MLLRRLDQFRMSIREVLGFAVGLFGLFVAVPDFGEQIEGLLAVVFEGGIFFQDTVELYLFGLGGELGVHRLGEQIGVLLYRRVDVEVAYGLQRFSGVL